MTKDMFFVLFKMLTCQEFMGEGRAWLGNVKKKKTEKEAYTVKSGTSLLSDAEQGREARVVVEGITTLSGIRLNGGKMQRIL